MLLGEASSDEQIISLNVITHELSITGSTPTVDLSAYFNTDTTYDAGTGVTLNGTTFEIGQEVATSSIVEFAGVTVNGSEFYW